MAVTLLRTRQVQALLQVDRTTIYRMVESGRLPAIRVGKQWRFPQPEIERWLLDHTVATNASAGPAGAALSDAVSIAQAGAAPTAARVLRELLPQAFCELILDAFADALGALLVVTDMAGLPQTAISHPGGTYGALARDPASLARLAPVWGALADSPVMEPRFVAAEGFLFARGLIRVGPALCGSVVVGHVDPAPDAGRTAEMADVGRADRLADATGLAPAWVARHADTVAEVDRVAQARALAAVQRIADIFSHMVEDRQALYGRIEAIASLTAVTKESPTEGEMR
jgi:excisionase family DNA binding protein